MLALETQLRADGASVAGVLSGTSADGIDVALTRIEVVPRIPGAGASMLAPPETLAFETEPFPVDLAARVRAVLDGQEPGLTEVALLHRDLGRAFGRAAREVAERHDVVLDLVGSHGQTVWHHDGVEPSGPATLQLGDGDFVAVEAGCPVVSDFRQRDIAGGGEGAPIAALVDDVLFADEPRPVAILNLGGMGNLTWLDDEPGPLSFDTGPAGALLDGLARRVLGQPFDRSGAAAARGTARTDVLEAALDHAFLHAPAPKSTGRDTFGEPWVERVLSGWRAAGVTTAEDTLATAVAFVARTVAMGLERCVDVSPARLLVAGGGVHHIPLMRALERECGVSVVPSSVAGVDPDAREALAFALLAARCVLGIPSTSPRATGAEVGGVLGKISPVAATSER